MREMEEALIKIDQVGIIPDTCKAIPISDFSSLGAAGSSLRQFVQSIAKPGGEGIYKVTFPQGFNDMTLSKFKNENAFIGSGMVDGSFKQARLTQMFGDPTQVFIAMALMSLQSKLNEINEMQREILDFMFDVEEAKLAGNLTIINKSVEDYKLNNENQSFNKQMLVQVGNIKREASQSEELYKKQILKIIETEDSFHAISKANDLVNKLRRNMRNYHLAFYIRSFTEFLEVFLMENFSEKNLNYVRDRFIAEKNAYDNQFRKCYTWSKQYLESAIGHGISPALKSFDEAYAKILSHVPFHLDRYFSADANKYISADTQLKQISTDKESGTGAFIDSIKLIKRLQDKPVEMYIEGEIVYISDEKGES